MYLCCKIARLDYTERIIESNDWTTYLLAFCFLLLAAAKYFYPRRFTDLLTLPFSDKYFTLHAKEGTMNHPFNTMLFVVQAITTSIFIYLLFRAFHPISVQENPWLFVQICTVYGVFVLVKFFVEKIVANIFSIDQLIDQYLFQKLSYRNLFAILLLIGNLLFLYSIPTAPVGLVIFAVGLLLLNAIALFTRYKKYATLISGNFFHFILYLCALEISPYIILYKLFVPEGTL